MSNSSPSTRQHVPSTQPMNVCLYVRSPIKRPSTCASQNTEHRTPNTEHYDAENSENPMPKPIPSSRDPPSLARSLPTQSTLHTSPGPCRHHHAPPSSPVAARRRRGARSMHPMPHDREPGQEHGEHGGEDADEGGVRGVRRERVALAAAAGPPCVREGQETEVGKEEEGKKGEGEGEGERERGCQHGRHDDEVSMRARGGATSPQTHESGDRRKKMKTKNEMPAGPERDASSTHPTRGGYTPAACTAQT